MNTIYSEFQEQFHVSSVRSFPEEWDKKTLLDAVGMKKDLIVAGPFGSNLKVSDYMDEGIPIIRLQNIDYGKFIDKEIKYISHEKARELAYHSFRAGDLVLAKLGDPIGKTCIVPDYFKDGIVVADVVRVRVADGLADKKFIMYSLNSVATKNQLINGTIGSTRPRVNLDQIRDIQILVPPLNEQRKIAAILSSVDAAIEQ
ncbi:MAG TPA: restriction endonuclease subunit S, partial [Methanothrix soehngenii]|nr:restriction endonuclease subunit S [Methanothrix soehngenii]